MTNIHKEYQTVQKPFTYALLLAATLALAACETATDAGTAPGPDAGAQARPAQGIPGRCVTIRLAAWP